MKLSRLGLIAGIACAPQLAVAGGLFLPGAGAVSTSRAGAGVASADDGEAITLNPAGLAKETGTQITLGAAIISYSMQFQRRGTYATDPDAPTSYAGTPYLLSKNASKPQYGLGSYQPVPVVSIISDLHGVIPGLHIGLGLYAPNAYPFRDMCSQTSSGCLKYQFNNDSTPPPSTRYDIMKQDAAILEPSFAAAYRLLPNLDIGARFSLAYATLKSTTALWGSAQPNYTENVRADGVFTIDAHDNAIPTFGVGATFRPTDHLELAVNYSYQVDIHAKGTASAELGPDAGVGAGLQTSILPLPDAMARCAAGGTSMANLKACVDLELPMNAQIGGRYKFLDKSGDEIGDIELDLDWEHWGKSCSDPSFDDGSCTNPGDYRVIVDAQAAIGSLGVGVPLQTAKIAHDFQDTYAARLGGSYRIPVGKRDDAPAQAPGHGPLHDEVIVRGGVGYDSAAAKDGWLRADLDGAARTTVTVGAGYRTRWFEVDVGGGVILEGSPSNPNVGGGTTPCTTSQAMPTCPNGANVGPSPVNPLLSPHSQNVDPVNQGDYKSHYVMFMLGASTWF
jgi:long-subunit fatty acid transport protein